MTNHFPNPWVNVILTQMWMFRQSAALMTNSFDTGRRLAASRRLMAEPRFSAPVRFNERTVDCRLVDVPRWSREASRAGSVTPPEGRRLSVGGRGG